MTKMTAEQHARLDALKTINRNARNASLKVRKDKDGKPMTTKDGKPVYVQPRRRYHLVGVQPVDTAPLTDTAAAYIQDAAARMAYTAVKTAYAKSGHPYLYNIMCAAPVSIQRRSTGVWWDMENVDEHGQPVPMQEYLRHKHKVAGIMVTDADKTLTTTEHGRAVSAELLESEGYAIFTDFDDIVSVGVVAIFDLAARGIIVNYADVWEVRRFVYREITRYINGQRKIVKETAANEKQAEAIERTTEDKSAAAEMLAALDADVICNISYELADRFPRNPETVRAVWEMTVEGYTVREIADKLNSGKSPVSRWQVKIRHFLEVERRDLLADLLY